MLVYLLLFSFFRVMMSQLTSAGNHSHFARLFLKQLVQVVNVLVLSSHISVTDCMCNNEYNFWLFLDV